MSLAHHQSLGLGAQGTELPLLLRSDGPCLAQLSQFIALSAALRWLDTEGERAERLVGEVLHSVEFGLERLREQRRQVRRDGALKRLHNHSIERLR